MTNQSPLQTFHADGFLRIPNAFPTSLAEQARTILWRDTKLDPNNPATWTQPVVRLGMYSDEPFIKAANTPTLINAYNTIVGEDKWQPLTSMGSFPVRFPSHTDPGDTGWHVDASFPGIDPTNYLEWRINKFSKGRALLMLFLFSDVGEKDAPTRISVGSHHDVAQLLEPYGDEGLSFIEVASKISSLPKRPEALATGKAGTVYLCHPFLVHAAQLHHGTNPKFMAQPPLFPKQS